jgi:hypothetical protein
MACECAIWLCMDESTERVRRFSIAITPKSIAHSCFPDAPAESLNPFSEIEMRTPLLAIGRPETATRRTETKFGGSNPNRGPPTIECGMARTSC